MKTHLQLVLLMLLSALAAPSAILAAPDAAETAEAAPTEDKDDRKNKTVLVLEAAPEKVHAAALEALAAIGCKVKVNKPDRIEGKRPNKVGLALGSGGEKLFVSIKDLGEGRTELTVVTKKSLMGIAGQKRWNDQVAEHVRNALE